ncbi:lysozyme g-like isoform X3 [Rana temporaria]|uniref:lysozyme g-like isoform X3 n=1 Tax=Rana temporaria TaxID=8407 RepID=UPI001AADBE42|nr:lysozyme g-like isoform X3 [Rana temporaria]
MSNYGNLNDIPCTGASYETGSQDGGNISGIPASEKLARTDLQRVNCYRERIKSVSWQTGVDAAIIAAIVSRESRGGAALDANKWGDHANAFGLMQIDKRWHTPRGAWDSEEHLLQATEILTSMFDAIKKKFPSWSKSHVMKGALAAYNMGPDSVYSFDAVDSRTTGADYSNDCVARAKFYKRNGF